MMLIGMLLLLALGLLVLFVLAALGYVLLMAVVSAAAGAWTRPKVGWLIAAATIGMPLMVTAGGLAVVAR
ncbi:hypothetical protein ACIBI4_09135 [Streptomyces sp. NPDC050418]|uniref:hypothetical protein n=1 Tax=Streptomyces sp. NPDC050418 TaxID=3365612 RepID=UPI00378BFAD5